MGAAALFIFALTFAQHAGNQSNRFDFPIFIKARTRDLAAGPACAASPAPIMIELSNDMVRVSAISLGHPRLAINEGRKIETVALVTSVLSESKGEDEQRRGADEDPNVKPATIAGWGGCSF